jgi:ferritin-like metal-binding protein YciE
MEKMKDLRDLLQHEVMDLYSAEEQIIAAMPKMIGKAKNPQLRQALEEHLKVTERQKARLDQVKKILQGGEEKEPKKKGILGLFGGGEQKCKGMQGLIEEGEKVMGEKMRPEVLDAAIIACAQKIEHYEICGYGTARAFARELNLGQVAELLEETLDEEYEADDLLTDLAVGHINEEAEETEEEPEYENEGVGNATFARGTRESGNTGSTRSEGGRTAAAPSKSAAGGKKAPATSKAATTRGSSSKGGNGNTAASKGTASKTAGSKGGSSKGNSGNSGRSGGNTRSGGSKSSR